MARFDRLAEQYHDDAGDPLISGKIFFYESGTNTEKDTFKDVNLTIPNTNPVILTAAGRSPNIFFNGTARAVLTDADEVQIDVADPVGELGATGAFDAWDSLTSYSVNDIVEGSDGLFYISITNSNQGNDPTTSATNWTSFSLLKDWNTNETYIANAPVIGSDGIVYTSIANGNSGNDPVGDGGVNWRDVAPATLANKTLINATFQGSITEETFTLSASALDPANGTMQVTTITGNTTFTDSLSDGQSLYLQVIDGDLHTVVFPAHSPVGGALPAFTGNDVYELWKIGSTLYIKFVGDV